MGKYGRNIGAILEEPLACNWMWKDRGILGNYLDAPGQHTPCYGKENHRGIKSVQFLDAAGRPFQAVFALFFQIFMARCCVIDAAILGIGNNLI